MRCKSIAICFRFASVTNNFNGIFKFYICNQIKLPCSLTNPVVKIMKSVMMEDTENVKPYLHNYFTITTNFVVKM
jgi:hypothetical protein